MTLLAHVGEGPRDPARADLQAQREHREVARVVLDQREVRHEARRTVARRPVRAEAPRLGRVGIVGILEASGELEALAEAPAERGRARLAVAEREQEAV